MGYLKRRLIPRSIRHAMHPVRTTKHKVKRALTPRPIRKLKRTAFKVAHPIEATESAIEHKAVDAVLGKPGSRKRKRKRRARARARAAAAGADPIKPMPTTAAKVGSAQSRSDASREGAAAESRAKYEVESERTRVEWRTSHPTPEGARTGRAWAEYAASGSATQTDTGLSRLAPPAPPLPEPPTPGLAAESGGPRTLDEFVGQERIKEQLALLIEAARSRGEPADHMLFSGPPGFGKATLAGIVAAEMGVGFRVLETSGSKMKGPGDLAAVLTNLEESDVLFVDEVLEVPKFVADDLYPALQDYELDIVIGKGPSTRSIRLDLPRFTMVAATTRPGRIALSLRERFGFAPRFDYYSVEDLARIARRSAGILEVELDAGGAQELARRSRGSPAVCIRLLRHLRDFAEVRADGKISGKVARQGLAVFEADEQGLSKLDVQILSTIVNAFGGGPVALPTLAAAVGEEPDSIEDDYLPYLLHLGFIQQAPGGVAATERTFQHLASSC